MYPRSIKILMIETIYSVHFALIPLIKILIDTCKHHITVANENINSKNWGPPPDSVGN